MSIIVQKFGGSSLADTEKISRVADLVVKTHQSGRDVVAVVSAMGKTTDSLLKLARQISSSPSRRELDMLLSVGERITMALLSMAIQARGHDAISLTGSQCGIMTNASHSNARIVEVRPFRVQDALANGQIVIVAGYQGTSYNREITTLGRGGSDTTAVALSAALDAERCEIYSDIEGVYTADPRVVLSAIRLSELSYDEMLELSRHGAKVLNAEAVEFARKAGIAIYTRSTFEPERAGTVIRKDLGQQSGPITGIASQKGVAAVMVPAGVESPMETISSILLNTTLVPEALTLGPAGEAMALFSQTENVDLGSVLDSVVGGDGRVLTDLGTVSIVGKALLPEVRREVLAELPSDVQIFGMFGTASAWTFVVAESDVDRLTRILHRAVFSGHSVKTAGVSGSK